MAVTKFQCPYCGRLGSTEREVPAGASARCAGCRGTFKVEATAIADQPQPRPRPVDPPRAPGSARPGPRPTARLGRKRQLIACAGFGAVVALGSIALGVGWYVAFRRPGAGAALATEEIAARCERSVAIVSGLAGAGSGFLVGEGLLATNAHVIDDVPPDQIRVTFPAADDLDRGPMVGRVVYFDPARDLAVLRVSTRLAPLPTAGDHKFRRGQDVVVIGNPGIGNGTLECVVSRGVIGSQVVEGGMAYYQLSGSVNPGNSGGPVIDTAGRVVGVVKARATRQEALGFCIPAVDLARAVRTAATQGAPADLLAARRHAEGVDARADPSEQVAAAMGRTDPATWVAMMDAERALADQSPEARRVRDVFDQAARLYADDRRGLALGVVRLAASLKEAGAPTSGLEILQGSIAWAPPVYFQVDPPVKFREFARLYEVRRIEGEGHQAALASLRESYREATSGAARPAAARPGPIPEATRFAPAEPAPPRPPSTAAAAEMLRLARSLELQKKVRGALHFYLDLVDDFPGTAEADEAARRIEVHLPRPSFGNRRPFPVLDVVDEATLLIDQGGNRTRVRLLGLDELPRSRPAGKGAPWEEQARGFLRGLLGGRSVFLEFERGTDQFDAQGRTVAYVHRADDRLDVNREMILRGYAVAAKYATLARAEDYRDVGLRARSRKVGLWQP